MAEISFFSIALLCLSCERPVAFLKLKSSKCLQE